MHENFCELYYLPLDSHGLGFNTKEALSFLDHAEMLRYQSYKPKHSKLVFLLTRYYIKYILAKKLSCAPNQVRFQYSQNGKPSLKDKQPLHFSLSHSHSAIAIGISSNNIGIDIEDTSTSQPFYRQAAQFINKQSAEDIASTNSEEEAIALFNLYWTVLESTVKYHDSSIFKERQRLIVPPINMTTPISSFNVNDLYCWTHKIETRGSHVSTLSFTQQRKTDKLDVYQIGSGNEFSRIKTQSA
ncbi:4'-phosphopantetheinyl transferase superfamily protein [Catenovulum sp. SM1970]|uniref:4'-phosphopantetheinyl transferase family protein n=1 Tax=Marinifaba aquimaris TaxID=2741323 RepID=UPI00157219CA|nr:4'-phosphopantetheinyl transferase superfamily protein [Marinifaba aquimaris]NTS75312.1 4'-phosphopantetheinyl transferase superfamily protein [Marinifaba aquimaris]